MNPGTIVFHANCPDGVVAAWLCWRAWSRRPALVPYAHGDPLPEIVAGPVLVLDLCFDEVCLRDWADQFGSVVVLDHHQTALNQLAHLVDPLEVTLNRTLDPSFRGLSVSIVSDRSGAGLAAALVSACWPGMEFSGPRVPSFVADIEDRDLWLHRRPDAAAVCAALDDKVCWRDLPESCCARLDELATLPRTALVDLGSPLLAAEAAAAAEFCNRSVDVVVAGVAVPFAEVPERRYGSVVANLLLDRFPSAPFAGYFCPDLSGRVAVGFRSSNDRADVAALAERFGGGGHRNASGCLVASLTDLAR
jgi:uncharacterized protein